MICICIAGGKKPRDFTRLPQDFWVNMKGDKRDNRVLKPEPFYCFSRGNLCNLVVSYKYHDFIEPVVNKRG